MKFGEILHTLRIKCNMTQKDLANQLSLSPSTIGMYEQNRRFPDAEILSKIADYFGVSLDYLMTGSDEPKEQNPELTARDERDIAKDLNSIMEKLSAGENAPASYDGEELDPEVASLFRDELEIMLRRLNLINKEKYTPKKV